MKHLRGYALGCVQLQRSIGSLLATDCKQLLIQKRLSWPLEEDLLLRDYRKLFASGDFPGEPIALSKTERHLVFRPAKWEFYLPIEEVRAFPPIEEVVPCADWAVATLEISPVHAESLRDVLPALPASARDEEKPVTMELHGKVAVRAKSAAHPTGVEVVLRNSRFTRSNLRCAMQRGDLERALNWGLRQFSFFENGNSLVVARRGDRTYCGAAYDQNADVQSTDGVLVRQSPLELVVTPQ